MPEPFVDSFFIENPELLLALVHGSAREVLAPVAQRAGFEAIPDPVDFTQYLLAPGNEAHFEHLVAANEEFWRTFFEEEEGINIRQVPQNWFRKQFKSLATAVYEEGDAAPIALGIVGQVYTSGRVDRKRILMSLRQDIAKLLAREFPEAFRIQDVASGEASKVNLDELSAKIDEARQQAREHEAALRRAEERVERLQADNEQLADKLERARADAKDARKAGREEAMEQAQDRIRRLQARVTELERQIAGRTEAHAAEVGELEARIRQLEDENADLEEALLGEDETEPQEELALGELAGDRIMIVGHDRVDGIRDAVEAAGGVLIHEPSDGKAAVAHLPVELVVFATDALSHATYYGVKDACRRSEIPYRHWSGSSVDSFVRVVGNN